MDWAGLRQRIARGQVIRAVDVAKEKFVATLEKHLLGLGFDAAQFRGATGFNRIEALHDACDALYTPDEARGADSRS